jgi:hypothetical protein
MAAATKAAAKAEQRKKQQQKRDEENMIETEMMTEEDERALQQQRLDARRVWVARCSSSVQRDLDTAGRVLAGGCWDSVDTRECVTNWFDIGGRK